MLKEIRKRVQEKVQKSSEVVLKAYQCMLRYHNSFSCSCDYCIKMREYVIEQRSLRILKRKYEDYYSIGPYCTLDYNQVREQNNKVCNLKVEKDQLKCL